MYTSYYGNMRNLPNDLIMVSISRYIPKGVDNICEFKELAPSVKLLDDYKSGKVSKVGYIREYIRQLSKYTPAKWLEKIVNYLLSSGIKTVEINKLCFLCYERYKDDNDEIVFCHRHIFANYMNSAYYEIREYGEMLCRLVISGTRHADDIDNEQICFRCMKYGIIKLLRKYPNLRKQNIEIIQGGAKGADEYARRFAMKYGFNWKQFDAEWDTYGRSAGYKRNAQMAEYAKSADVSALIAFPTRDVECKGTEIMIDIARKYGFNHIMYLYIDVGLPFY